MINNYSFEILRTIHIYLAIIFIFVLTLVIPLTINSRKIHKILGISYILFLIALLFGGLIMDINQLVFLPNNLHALVNILIKNISFTILSIIGVVILYPEKQHFKLLIFKLLKLISIVLISYGLLYEFINLNTNRSNPLLTQFYVLPSYVILGAFYLKILNQIKLNNYFISSSKALKVKFHQKIMSAALFLNLLSPMTAELNRVDIFHSDLLFLIVIIFAIIAFQLVNQFEKNIKVFGRILCLSLIGLIFSISFYIFKQQNHYQYMAIKILSFDKLSAELKQNSPTLTSGCNELPSLFSYQNGHFQLVKLFQCHSALDSRYLINESLINNSNQNKKMKSITSFSGVGNIYLRQNIDVRYPFVLINLAKSRVNDLQSVDKIFLENRCKVYLDLNIVNYLSALPNSRLIKIYFCEELQEGSKQEFLIKDQLDRFKSTEINYLWLYRKD